MSSAQGLLQLYAALLICKAKLNSTPLWSHLLREWLGKPNQERKAPGYEGFPVPPIQHGSGGEYHLRL